MSPHVDPFTLELTTQRLAEPGKAAFRRGIGRVERRAD
jgi:hypothetical protein